MSSDIEKRPYGNLRQMIENNTIALIVGSGDMRRPAVDEWATLMIDTINHFPHPTHSYVLLDITHPSQGFTPYSSSKSNDILNAVETGRQVRLAILFRDTLIYSVINIFLNRAKVRSDIFEFQAFTDRDKALAWLKEQYTLTNSDTV